MEYTVKKLAQMAGISPRTLRYYDEIGLLMPCRINSSGYRIYGENEVDALQQILLFRELGLPLETISAILSAPGHDRLKALEAHRKSLAARMEQLSLLSKTVDKTIRRMKGEITMADNEKFEGLKESLIQENETKYGNEIREKYGAAKSEKSNQAFRSMSAETYEDMNTLGNDIQAKLNAAVKKRESPISDEGHAIALAHRNWITRAWGYYDKAAHAGVADLYVDDPRFTAYYDSKTPGCAAFLRDAVAALCKED